MKVMIADYRWQGHRLLHILKLREILIQKSVTTYLQLPKNAYASKEWSINSIAAKNSNLDEDVFNRSTTKRVPLNIEKWVNDVIGDAIELGVSLILFPWADKLIEYIRNRSEYDDNVPHIHLLLGRCPPDYFRYNNDESTYQLIKDVSETNRVCVGRLCATLDKHVGNQIDGLNITGNNKWVVDPVYLPIKPNQRQARRKLKLPMNKKYILLIGDLSNRKNVITVVKEWEEIYKATNISLILAGLIDSSADMLAEEVERVKAVYPDSIITDFKYISNYEFINYIAASDGVICTNREPQYISSGVLGLSTVLGKACFINNNYYLEKLVNESKFGLSGDIESKDTPNQMRDLIKIHPQSIEVRDVDYCKFFDQWVGNCLTDRVTHLITNGAYNETN